MKIPFRIIAVLFFFGCTKNKEIADLKKPVEFSGHYQTVQEANLNKVRMYTKDVIITDTMLILNYLTRVAPNFISSISFNSSTSILRDSLLQLDFIDSGKIKVEYNLATFVKGKYDGQAITRSDSELVIQGLKKDTVLYSIFTFPEYPSLPEINIGKFGPWETCTPLPTSTGYYKMCIRQQLLPLQMINNDLYLPLIDYFVARTRPTSYTGYSTRNVFNILNNAIKTQLSQGDTVIIQTKQLKLQKS